MSDIDWTEHVGEANPYHRMHPGEMWVHEVEYNEWVRVGLSADPLEVWRVIDETGEDGDYISVRLSDAETCSLSWAAKVLPVNGLRVSVVPDA